MFFFFILSTTIDEISTQQFVCSFYSKKNIYKQDFSLGSGTHDIQISWTTLFVSKASKMKYITVFTIILLEIYVAVMATKSKCEKFVFYVGNSI